MYLYIVFKLTHVRTTCKTYSTCMYVHTCMWPLYVNPELGGGAGLSVQRMHIPMPMANWQCSQFELNLVIGVVDGGGGQGGTVPQKNKIQAKFGQNLGEIQAKLGSNLCLFVFLFFCASQLFLPG